MFPFPVVLLIAGALLLLVALSVSVNSTYLVSPLGYEPMMSSVLLCGASRNSTRQPVPTSSVARQVLRGPHGKNSVKSRRKVKRTRVMRRNS